MSDKVIPPINPKIIDEFRTYFENQIGELFPEDKVVLLVVGSTPPLWDWSVTI